LAPSEEVDQLNASLYRAPEILQSLALISRLGRLLDRPNVPFVARMLTVIRLFSFLSEKTRAPGYDPSGRHIDLQAILKRIIGLIAAQYGGEEERPRRGDDA